MQGRGIEKSKTTVRVVPLCQSLISMQFPCFQIVVFCVSEGELAPSDASTALLSPPGVKVRNTRPSCPTT